MIRTFERRTDLAAPAEEAFAWHERPGAFHRLAPPWETIEVIESSGGIRDGGRLSFRLGLGPAWQRWDAEHFGYQEGRQFCDRQVRGPFAFWEHVHRFEPHGSEACAIEDRVRYRLPVEPLSRFAPRALVEDKIAAGFAWRSFTARHDIEFHHRLKLEPTRVLVTGSSGLVGSQLLPFLTTGGHTPVRLLRGSRRGGADSLTWNPRKGFDADQLSALEGTGAVVNLAGESILGLWTEKKKQALRTSRVDYTRALCEGLAKLKNPPRVLVSASASGIYGSRENEELTEDSLQGTGFLADLAREWEAATKPAEEAGIRVVHLRIGMVVDPRGGAVGTARLPFSLGMGGRLGTGRQWMSWIALDDLISLILFAIGTPGLSGPVNAVAPKPVTNADFTRALAHALHRPSAFPVPAFLLRRLAGELADEVFLSSARLQPKRALAAGFRFRHPELEPALRLMLGKQTL